MNLLTLHEASEQVGNFTSPKHLDLTRNDSFPPPLGQCPGSETLISCHSDYILAF